MDAGERSDLLSSREYAWKYFSLHAEQRLKTFNFYLIFETVVIGSIAPFFKEKSFSSCLFLSLMVTLISIIFYLLDKRNKTLVKHGEEALKYVEIQLAHPPSSEHGLPHVLQIFTREKALSDRDTPATFSKCFNTVFLIFALLGVVLTAIVIWKVPI